jgi:hypothetical protein
MSLKEQENKTLDEKEDKKNKNKANNNNQYSYKKDLWMYFESINSKFKKDRQKVKSFMYIISQKNSLADEYADNLDSLYNQFYVELNYFIEESDNSNIDNKKYSLDNLLCIYLENIKTESELFKNYSKIIRNEFLKNLEQNINLQYELNSQLNEQLKKYELNFIKVIKKIEQIKKDYQLAGNSVENSKKEFEIMKEEIDNQNNKDKADNLRFKKCETENIVKIEEAKKKKKIYEDYIIDANKEREKYIDLSEKIYDSAQKLDKEYIDLIKKNMSILFNSQLDLINKFLENNKKMLKIINIIDFNFELEQFANSKFPKFSLPKPFVYEQYTPFLLLRERNEKDAKLKNHEIYKTIVNDLNHLFHSENQNLNNIKTIDKNNDNNDDNKNNKINEDNNEEKEIDYIRNIVHEIWNNKKINLLKISKLLKKEKLRTTFLEELNRYRVEGIFLVDKMGYDNLGSVFNIIIDRSKKAKDYENIKTCMILSETFYYKSIDKVSLQKEILKNDIWKENKFWGEIIEYFINEEINTKYGFIVFLEENNEQKGENKRKERIKNSVNSVLVTFSYNMKLFKVPKNERKNIINIFIKRYKIEDFVFIENEIEDNEVENDILAESISSNIDIQPNDNENNNEKNNEKNS